MKQKSVLIGLAVTVFFSALSMLGVFDRMDNLLYDMFLRFRPDREQPGNIVFLDVDDNAIAYNGVFPWPRSIMADGLLRLKEYGARVAIFDIEYIDKGPQGVDDIYLRQGLPSDFNRSFSSIRTATMQVLSALGEGRADRGNIDEYAQTISQLIGEEQRNLFARTQGIARDNDEYLIQSSALFGRSWVTLNLRAEPLSGEQAERRIIAEERFPVSVEAAASAVKGNYVDILPALPGFALTGKGAGFTNVVVDKDGIRRRVDLVQNINDHWYPQLAFAPMLDYLGNPALELDNRKLIIKEARLPDGAIKDIVIPLDGNGSMMLDWPKTDYIDSYHHISFADFSLLEELEANLEYFGRAFEDTEINLFSQFDSDLANIPFIAWDLADFFDLIHEAKRAALEHCSEEYFAQYVEYRHNSRKLIQQILDIDPAAKIQAVLPDLIEMNPANAEFYREEAEYITRLEERLRENLEAYETTSRHAIDTVKDAFCILGRVDTGTTDIGANPFYGKYVNVGTHGVVLDMILSESFITPLSSQWHMAFVLLFVCLFFLVSERLSMPPRVTLGVIVTVLIIVASALLFRFTGIFFNPLMTVLVIMVSAIIIREIMFYAISDREKQFINKAFSTYVSQDVVKEIIADPSRLQLGGTKRHMSAIFTDIAGFSTISEKLDPEHLVSLLNLYLTAMSDVILEEKGTIDKYEGDAIIAFFGAPIELPDHALRACVSAITMKKIEKDFNKKVMEEKLSPSPIFTRVGINTGSMVAGNMGTDRKMNYTIMGNSVNLAARLEGVNKQYGTAILAADATIRETNGLILARRLDRVRVVGIHEPVRIHEPINTMEKASPEEKKLVEVFHQALDYFENRRWKEAGDGFRESLAIETALEFHAPERGPSAKYIDRCTQFLANPPAEDWDGVYTMGEK